VDPQSRWGPVLRTRKTPWPAPWPRRAHRRARCARLRLPYQWADSVPGVTARVLSPVVHGYSGREPAARL